MIAKDCIRARRSVRAFSDKDVEISVCVQGALFPVFLNLDPDLLSGKSLKSFPGILIDGKADDLPVICGALQKGVKHPSEIIFQRRTPSGNIADISCP